MDMTLCRKAFDQAGYDLQNGEDMPPNGPRAVAVSKTDNRDRRPLELTIKDLGIQAYWRIREEVAKKGIQLPATIR